MHAPRPCRRRPSRAAALVIGPATSGRTRWRPPQGDGKCAAIFQRWIVLAAPLRARVMPTPSREERRPGSLRESPRGGAPVSQWLTPSPPFPFQRSNKNRKQDADRRGHHRRTFGRGAAQRGGSSVGVPPRLSPKGVVVPKARLQARFPGTRSDAGWQPIMRWRQCQRALPAIACPSPGSTSRPGRNAGGHDAQAAREQGGWPHPRAPHSPRRPGVPSRRRPY